MDEKSPFDLLVNLLVTQVRAAVREEIHAAITGNGHESGSEPLLDVEQLAKALEVKKTWVYEETRKKSDPKKTDLKDQPIPHFRVGRYPRFELSKVKAWLEARQKNN